MSLMKMMIQPKLMMIVESTKIHEIRLHLIVHVMKNRSIYLFLPNTQTKFSHLTKIYLQATILSQKCLRKCSSHEDCKSKKKKCLCDGACGMSCIKPGNITNLHIVDEYKIVNVFSID